MKTALHSLGKTWTFCICWAKQPEISLDWSTTNYKAQEIQILMQKCENSTEQQNAGFQYFKTNLEPYLTQHIIHSYQILTNGLLMNHLHKNSIHSVLIQSSIENKPAPTSLQLVSTSKCPPITKRILFSMKSGAHREAPKQLIGAERSLLFCNLYHFPSKKKIGSLVAAGSLSCWGASVGRQNR